MLEGELERAREQIWSYLDNLYMDKQTNKQTDGQALLVPKVSIATEKKMIEIHFSKNKQQTKHISF